MFGGEYLGGIVERRQHIGFGQVIFLLHGLHGHAASELGHDELDGDADP